MRILFIGAVKFSAITLTKLLKKRVNIVGICTLENSIFNSDHKDLTIIAEEYKIPVKYTPDINKDENLKWIKEMNPDIIFCFGWSKLIKKQLLSIPHLGIIGYHPSKIPHNRGRHPLIWALVLGLNKTASTFFKIDEGPDTGDILLQQDILISKNDNAQTLYNKVTKVALCQIDEILEQLNKKQLKLKKQNLIVGNVWRKRTKSDGIIDWRMSASMIYNLVRGLTKPYPGAHFQYENKEIKVWGCKVIKSSKINVEPGKILKVNSDGILVKVGNNAILLTDIEPKIIIKQNQYLY